MKKELKVVYLLPGFPADEDDVNCFPYIQDFMTLMKSEIGAQNMEVVAIHYPFRKATYSWKGIRVNSVGGKNAYLFFKPFIWIKVLILLARIYSKKPFEIIHCFWLNEPAFIARIFNVIFKVKILVTVIGQDPLPGNRYLRFINRKSIMAIGISNFVSKKLAESTGREAEAIIPLVWDKTRMTGSEEKVEYYDVLGVGNLSQLKNFELFIEAIAILKHRKPDIRAAIIGKGEEYENLIELISRKNLIENITLKGELRRNLTYSYMMKARVLLHTSRYESQGFVMSEGLYFGMKIVSTEVSDTATNPNIRTGKDARDLAIQVHSCLESVDRTSVTFYDPAKAISKYLDIYNAAS